MARSLRTLAALGLGWFFVAAAPADEVVSQHRPVCPPGHTTVEEVLHKEVVRHHCKYVTETKKVVRTVYEFKEEPFCLPKCEPCSWFGLHKKDCRDCNPCEPPYCRRILVKREIVEEVPVCRCVIETVKVLAPVKVSRQVPCDVAPLRPPQGPPKK